MTGVCDWCCWLYRLYVASALGRAERVLTRTFNAAVTLGIIEPTASPTKASWHRMAYFVILPGLSVAGTH